MNIESLSQSGVTGLALAVAVLAAIYLAKRVKLVKNGDMARLLNLVLSAVVSGVATDPSSLEKQITLLVCSLAAAGLHELFSWLAAKFPVENPKLG